MIKKFEVVEELAIAGGETLQVGQFVYALEADQAKELIATGKISEIEPQAE